MYHWYTTAKSGSKNLKMQEKDMALFGAVITFVIVVLFNSSSSSSSLIKFKPSASYASPSEKIDLDAHPGFIRSFEESHKDFRPAANLPAVTPKSHKTFLVGIFSVNTPDAKKRRQLIRDTYLMINPSENYPENERVIGSSKDPRICSLYTYLDSHNADTGDHKECVMLYTFVLGHGGENSPMDHYRDNREMVIPHHRVGGDVVEGDMVYLNIKENKDFGKSPAYFKWASSLASVYGIDYIGKLFDIVVVSNSQVYLVLTYSIFVDDYTTLPIKSAKANDDTMIHIPSLFQYVINPLPPRPFNERVYGGRKIDYLQCGKQRHCEAIVPFGYMASEFYFLSADLAEKISSDDMERKEPIVSSEGRHFESMDIATYIFKHAQTVKMPITEVSSGEGVKYWVHPVKHEEEWLSKWNMFINEGIPYV